jgi:hypothetical protein
MIKVIVEELLNVESLDATGNNNETNNETIREIITIDKNSNSHIN